jgi:Protein of unknown function (DUF3300)
VLQKRELKCYMDLTPTKQYRKRQYIADPFSTDLGLRVNTPSAQVFPYLGYCMIFPRTISGQRADWKLLAMILLSCCLLPGSLGAQAPPPPLSPPVEAERAPKPPSEKLNQLLGPIALYPDALVALILPASTVPSDVVLAAAILPQTAIRRRPGTNRGTTVSSRSSVIQMS